MQKKLIALAVASALTVPALALADTGNVTIYGSANVSYDFVDSGANGNRSQRVSSNTSTLGLKGSEDLGDGLTAVWQVEQGIDMTGAGNSVLGGGTASTFGTQNTFVGLSSATMGTVVLGRHDTPYKLATRGFDQFANGIADNRSLMGLSSSAIGVPFHSGAALGTTNTAVAFDGRQPDVIAYISPAMAGLTIAVGHVNLNQDLGLSQSSSADHNSGAWSVAGLYGNGPLFASLAYETHDLESALTALGHPYAGAEEHAAKLGLGYTADAFSVGFAYETTSDNIGSVLGAPGADILGHNAYYLSGKFNINGSDAIKAAYSRIGDLSAVADTAANQFSLGYDHAMSKRTTVYALYTRLNNGANGAYGLSGSASSANIASGAGSTVAGVGSDPSAVSIGLKHSF
jgi:predicted porin